MYSTNLKKHNITMCRNITEILRSAPVLIVLQRVNMIKAISLARRKKGIEGRILIPHERSLAKISHFLFFTFQRKKEKRTS